MAMRWRLRSRRRARARDGDARGATARMDWVIFYDCHRDVREGDGGARARGRRRRRRARRDRGIDRWHILWTAVGGGVCQVTIGRWSRPVVEIFSRRGVARRRGWMRMSRG
jgi:hypothetical protein